jgi:hypothetical protein
MGGFWYIFYGGFIEVFILVDIVGKLTADRPFFLFYDGFIECQF